MRSLRAHQERSLKLFLSGLKLGEQEQLLILFEKAVSNMELSTFE